jgi:hypothetical protein
MGSNKREGVAEQHEAWRVVWQVVAQLIQGLVHGLVGILSDLVCVLVDQV